VVSESDDSLESRDPESAAGLGLVSNETTVNWKEDSRPGSYKHALTMGLVMVEMKE